MPSIFITGGAAGIGLATAERFGREGWTVGVYDVDTAALAEVQATHPDWITGELDVRDPDQWVRALEEFTSHTGGTLDVLDNNAGVLVAGELGRREPGSQAVVELYVLFDEVPSDVGEQLRGTTPPDLVVVNPPRRGIGADLAGWLESSSVEHVLYSSCNLDSLAADLAAMPSLLPVRARLFDMFPQTTHREVLTLLRRR